MHQTSEAILKNKVTLFGNQMGQGSEAGRGGCV